MCVLTREFVSLGGLCVRNPGALFSPSGRVPLVGWLLCGFDIPFPLTLSLSLGARGSGFPRRKDSCASVSPLAFPAFFRGKKNGFLPGAQRPSQSGGTTALANPIRTMINRAKRFGCGFASLGRGIVAQAGSLPYRGLAIRSPQSGPCAGRLPVGDTAGCQPALRPIRAARAHSASFLELYSFPSV